MEIAITFFVWTICMPSRETPTIKCVHEECDGRLKTGKWHWIDEESKRDHTIEFQHSSAICSSSLWLNVHIFYLLNIFNSIRVPVNALIIRTLADDTENNKQGDAGKPHNKFGFVAHLPFDRWSRNVHSQHSKLCTLHVPVEHRTDPIPM